MGWHVDRMGQDGCENSVSESTEALSTASGLAVIVTVIVPLPLLSGIKVTPGGPSGTAFSQSGFSDSHGHFLSLTGAVVVISP